MRRAGGCEAYWSLRASGPLGLGVPQVRKPRVHGVVRIVAAARPLTLSPSRRFGGCLGGRLRFGRRGWGILRRASRRAHRGGSLGVLHHFSLVLICVLVGSTARTMSRLRSGRMRTASHSVAVRAWLGGPAPKRHEQTDEEQEQHRPEGHDPEDDIPVRQPGEEIAEQRQGVVVNLRPTAVRAQHARTHKPGEHGDHQEASHESETEVGQLTACA
jgi:hypothetical protein